MWIFPALLSHRSSGSVSAEPVAITIRSPAFGTRTVHALEFGFRPSPARAGAPNGVRSRGITAGGHDHSLAIQRPDSVRGVAARPQSSRRTLTGGIGYSTLVSAPGQSPTSSGVHVATRIRPGAALSSGFEVWANFERVALLAARERGSVSAHALARLAPSAAAARAADSQDSGVDTAAQPIPISSTLPIQMSTFVGRDREVGQVRGLLAASRLLTLTGTGGMGKTRLAVEIARGVAKRGRVCPWPLPPRWLRVLPPRWVAFRLLSRIRPRDRTARRLRRQTCGLLPVSRLRQRRTRLRWLPHTAPGHHQRCRRGPLCAPGVPRPPAARQHSAVRLAHYLPTHRSAC